MSNLLIRDATVLTMDAADTVHDPGWVWIEDGLISAVGESQPPAGIASRAERVIRGAGKALLPGLVNAHTHLSQSFMRGLGDEKTLLEWLKTVMWPIQEAMTPKDVRLASLLGLAENVRCGVTAVGQHHKITTSPAHVDATMEAAEQVGLRVQVARGWVDLGDAAEAADDILRKMERLMERWHNGASGRITLAFGPMAPWRCSDETMRRTVEQARAWGIRTHMHVAEAAGEIQLLQERTGMRNIEWLDALGALGPDLQLVHCVHLEEKEIEAIASEGATVVHCPTSNMYLASGIAPVPEMLAREIPVALGTDGSASNNTQDILETVKTAALLARTGSGRATALTPLEALRMVTTAGARFLGRQDLGQITAGFAADLTLVNLNTLRAAPVHNAAGALVFNASGPDVDTVIVDGRLLLDGGRLTMLNEDDLMEQCRQAAGRLLARAGVKGERGVSHGA